MLNGNANSDLRPRRSVRDLGAFVEAVAAVLVASLAIAVLPYRLFSVFA